LPHSGEQSNAVSNDRIRQINRQLKAIALAEDVTYLISLFTDAQEICALT